MALAGCPRSGAVVDERPPLDPGGVRWVSAITATGPVVVRSVAFAGDQVVAAGEFDGTLAIGEVRASSKGGRDGFVARFDAAGAVAWVKTLGGPGDDRASAVAISGDRIIVGGEHGAGARIGDVTLRGAGKPDGFVAELSSAGEVSWARAIGASRYASVASVAALDGDVLAAGQFAGVIADDDGEIHSAGNQDAFVARFGRGERRWFRRAGGPGADLATAVVTGPGGEIAVAGAVMDGAAIGAVELETIGDDPDAFVARLDAGGQPVWVRQLGGPGNDSAAALAITGDQIAVGGRFTRDLAGAGSTVTAAGGSDGFVVWVSLGGQPSRATSIGGEGADAIAAIAAGGGGLVVGGSFTGRAGGDLQSAGELDGLVGKLAGTQSRWRRPLGGPGDDAVTAVATDPGGAVAVGLSFAGVVTIDGQRLDGGAHAAAAVIALEP